MELSKRLQAVADCVTGGNRVADIGTDHGYIPIWLVQNQISPKAYAMDINAGPLERAKIHIERYGLQEQIETRLSDGTKALSPGEADTLVIAGMGGGLMIHILEQDPENKLEVKEWVFEPQSELEEFRRYLFEHQFYTVSENMIKEDGKYYPVIKARKAVEGELIFPEDPELGFRYGTLLLNAGHPVLHELLLKEKGVKEEICQALGRQNSARSFERKKELEEELLVIKKAISLFER